MPRRVDPLPEPAAPFSGDLLALVSRGDQRRYKKGTLLIQEGDTGDTLFAIVSGRLRAYSVNPANGREITYGTYGAGEYLGEMSLDGGPRSASVITLETTVCSVIGRSALQAFIAERPAFAFELLAKVIRRARAATLTAQQLALNDVYGRLKLLLDALATRPLGDARAIDDRPTHQEIANRIGCTREMVSRVMKDLVRGGHVVVDGNGWLLPGPLPMRW
ncbi:MAG: Crp/Fnr family transcriptional regulator [Rubrivivax sp.]|nr:Crp/Fnr family transcriptional regulator [Rubrivivax sp.]